MKYWVWPDEVPERDSVKVEAGLAHKAAEAWAEEAEFICSKHRIKSGSSTLVNVRPFGSQNILRFRVAAVTKTFYGTMPVKEE